MLKYSGNLNHPVNIFSRPWWPEVSRPAPVPPSEPHAVAMVHQVQVQERSPRKRDRRTAGLMLNPGGGPDLPGIRGTDFKGDLHPPPTKISRLGMYETYQPWVLQTYGDSAKTKTITRNKYQRILQILRGDYVDNETSKFKLWVKGRGFRIGPPPGYLNGGVEDPIITQLTPPPSLDYNPDKDPYPDIYVQTGTVKVGYRVCMCACVCFGIHYLVVTGIKRTDNHKFFPSELLHVISLLFIFRIDSLCYYIILYYYDPAYLCIYVLWCGTLRGWALPHRYRTYYNDTIPDQSPDNPFPSNT